MMTAQRPHGHAPLAPTLRTAYQRLIEERVGIRLSDQQLRGFDGVLATVLAAGGAYLTPDDLYLAFRRGERADLFDTLAARMTIGETHFFRVAPQIAALRDVVLPELIAQQASQRRLNLWSAGCSSGEEPYTLAILLRELLPATPETEGWRIRLLATDLSVAALDAARRARYRDWSFRETPERIRRRYFEREGDTWHLDSAIRRMVSFATLNLVADPFPAPSSEIAAFDLILCRNVTIYFSPDVTNRLYRRFAGALAPGGWLILGPSDPAPPGDVFSPVYQSGAILWRKVEPPAPSLPPRPPVVTERAVKRSPLPPARPVVAAERRPASPPSAAAARSADPVAPRKGQDSELGQVRAFLRAGAREAARECLVGLVRESPLSVAAHRMLGLLALEDGDASVALESLRRATFLDADDPLAQFGLGRAYRALGDENRARAAFRHARRLVAAWPSEQPVPGDPGLAVDDLRSALDAQLGVIGDQRKGAS